MPLDLHRQRDLGRILDDAFAAYRAHWGALTVVALAVVVPVDLVVLGGGLGWLWSGYVPRYEPHEVLVPALAVLVLVAPLVSAMTIRAVVEVAEGSSPRPASAIHAGLEAFGALLPAMLLVAAGIACGVLAFFVPAVVLFVMWSVVPQVVVVERLRGPAALRRSWELVRGAGLWTASVLLVLLVAQGVVGAAITLPLDLAAEAADLQALVLAGTIVAQALTYPLFALAMTLAYFALRARKGETTGIPGADPWERRLGEGWLPPTG